ncbi:hypothetical protein PR048_005579 [Dryococelus australis]|uniref:Uncharacterized protein n=1 Tax=Dryococelus australis TaxID=614101 RepID=A0ABQ9I8M8_9NEOP|nr:hypothetical protein PR048_005579 [Dryococelus australis]
MILKKKLESFNLVLLLILQCEFLEALNAVSKSLQSNIVYQLKTFVNTGKYLKVFARVELVRQFDGLCEDERLQEQESFFRMTVFHTMVDALCTQLDNRFPGIIYVLETYQVIQTELLANEKDVHDKTVAFVRKFPDDVSHTFPSLIKASFKGKL